jgi:hypothetical protein
MPSRPRKHRQYEDVNEAAFCVMQEATEKHDPDRPENPAAVAPS